MLLGKSREIAPGRRKHLGQSGNDALLSCLFNLYAEYIMGNARLDES